MLELDGLSKSFGKTRAVRDVSLQIPSGEMVGVIGRSGAGKSTLLRLVNRLTDPSAGRVMFNGAEVSALGGRDLLRWRARCAMIFQQFNLVNRLDVLTNVLIGRINRHGAVSSLFNRFSDEERTIAIRALDRLDLAPQALQRAETLSGGQQQRVAIARAMVQQPEIILADEPIASLDPRNAERVMNALRAINREDGITVLCNLHTLDTARKYCGRIIGMAGGAVVFDGAPEALTKSRIQEIYGAVGEEGEISESITSTAFPGVIGEFVRTQPVPA